MGATHIRLAKASEAELEGALHTAWKRRVEMNLRGGTKKKTAAKKTAAKKPAARKRRD
jgi:hypothetical protein